MLQEQLSPSSVSQALQLRGSLPDLLRVTRLPLNELQRDCPLGVCIVMFALWVVHSLHEVWLLAERTLGPAAYTAASAQAWHHARPTRAACTA